MLTVILASALLSTAGLQDGTIAPDRAAYEDLVRCAGVYQASIAQIRVPDAGAADEALSTAQTGFRHLAYLYAAPLGEARPATDAAIERAFEEALRPVMIARTRGALDAARRDLATNREICRAVLIRVSGTS